MSVQAIAWSPSGAVRIVDQRALPEARIERDLESAEAVADAIRTLQVRGAPLIGCAAAMGLVAGTRELRGAPREEFLGRLAELARLTAATRPTAVNLRWALERMARGAAATPGDGAALWDGLRAEATAIWEEDRAMCRRIGEAGVPPRSRRAPRLPPRQPRAPAARGAAATPGDGAALWDGLRAEATAIWEEDRAVCSSDLEAGLPLVPDGATVLTHCNAGALATGGIGTALAPIYLAHEAGRRVHVFVDETRPVLQGARLTAWELAHAGIACTLIADAAAGSLMRQAKVDLVIVGADRIAANGDFANKIGTYPLAVLALHHGVPFYCAAPRRSSLRRASVARSRSEEHTSELQSQSNLVCRLLLEKKHEAELLTDYRKNEVGVLGGEKGEAFLSSFGEALPQESPRPHRDLRLNDMPSRRARIDVRIQECEEPVLLIRRQPVPERKSEHAHQQVGGHDQEAFPEVAAPP